MHKTANVLAKLPKSQQPKCKRALQENLDGRNQAAAELAFDAFIQNYTPKYEKAADCLSKDRDTWIHLPTTNPIESTFATVRHLKLLEGAQKAGDVPNQLPKLLGVTFSNGIEVIAKPADRQPLTAAA